MVGIGIGRLNKMVSMCDSIEDWCYPSWLYWIDGFIGPIMDMEDSYVIESFVIPNCMYIDICIKVYVCLLDWKILKAASLLLS